MTTIDALIDEIKASFASGGKFFTIDAETYHKVNGNRDIEFTAKLATETARSLLCAGVSRYATVEEFEQVEQGTMPVFVIVANSMNDWRVACLQIRNRVIDSFEHPAEIVCHHVIDTRLDPESQ